jgi:DNA polymerase-3 subunit epsilon
MTRTRIASPEWLARLPPSIGFFDVETTGFYESDRIVSFACIGLKTAALATGAFELEYSYLIFNPGKRSHPRAEEVHGYSDRLLRLQQPFSECANEVSSFLSSHDLLVAHNAAFDVGFVNREMALAGLRPISRPVYCTKQGYQACGFGDSASLDSVCKKINLARAGEIHGALEDAWLAMRVYLWLKDCPLEVEFPDALPRQPTNLLEEALERSTRRTSQKEIRVPEPIKRPRLPAQPPKKKPVPTEPISPHIEIRRLEPAKPTEEIRVPQTATPARSVGPPLTEIRRQIPAKPAEEILVSQPATPTSPVVPAHTPQPAVTAGRTMEQAEVRRFMIWASITTFCGFAVCLLSPCIWLFTLYLAYLTSFQAVLAVLFLPFIAQLYWIWILWNATGTLLNLFTLLCFAWVALALVGIFARMKAATVGK